MKTFHNITEKQTSGKRPVQGELNEQQKRSKQQSLDSFLKITMEEEIVRMVAESIFSFNQIATTPFIRQFLATKYLGKIVPRDNKRASARMMKFYVIAETETKEEIHR